MRARQYAEANFDIEKIADRFEGALTQAAEMRSQKRSKAPSRTTFSTAVRRSLWLSDE